MTKPIIRLSPRQNEICDLLAAGLTDKEISSKLNISEHTVAFHLGIIFKKLAVPNRSAAVAQFLRVMHP